MAMRRATAVLRLMEAQRRTNVRCLSDGTGRVLGEEERAAENIYIQKMERALPLEKLRKKAEEENADEEEKADEKEKFEKDKENIFRAVRLGVTSFYILLAIDMAGERWEKVEMAKLEKEKADKKPEEEAAKS